jgi:hypothetical protein
VGWAVAAIDADGDVQLRYIRDLVEANAAASAEPDLALNGDSFRLVTDPAIPGDSNGVGIEVINECWGPAARKPRFHAQYS